MSIFYSGKVLFSTFLIALLYIILTIYLMNFTLVKNTLFMSFPLFYKVRLLLALLEGMWTAMSFSSLLLLFLIALLTGANLTLLYNTITTLKKFDKLQIVVGGNSLLGIIGSGCAACGLPLVSLFGLSGSLIFLPFHGRELSYISLILLSVSFYLLIKNRDRSCKIIINK